MKKSLFYIAANICVGLVGFRVMAQTTNGSINTMLNSATLTYNGTAAQLIPDGTAFPSHGIYNLVIDNTAGVSSAGNSYVNLWGTLSLNNGILSPIGSFYFYGNISVGAGQIKAGNSTVGFWSSTNPQTIPNNAFVNNTIKTLTINNSGGGVSSSGTLNVPNVLTLQNGTFTLGGNLNIGGVINYTSGSITAGNDTVTFNGGTVQTIPDGTFTSNSVNNLAISNAAGISFGGPITQNSLSLINLGAAIPLSASGQTANIGGPLTIYSFASTPTNGQSFTIVSAGTVNGTFSNLSLPAGYNGTLSYTSTTAVLTLSSVLPLTLLDFSGYAKNDAVQLQWTTADEVNTSRFVMERSMTGIDFIAIGTVTAAGSGDGNYSFSDNKPNSGINYYRLRSIDKDGSFTYSKIVKVNLAVVDNITLGIYPNPAKGLVSISHISAGVNAFIKLVSMDGKPVTMIKVAKGSTQTQLDAFQFASGEYVVVFYNQGKITTAKLVVE